MINDDESIIDMSLLGLGFVNLMCMYLPDQL